jgi:hypothetical protein
VEQVYARGYLTANEDSKNSPEQQAFQRVDSFIHGGQAQELDEDLTEVAVPNGSKHMHIIRSAIKRYESKKNPLKEDVIDEEGVPPLGYTTAKNVVKAARWAHKRYKEAKRDSQESKNNRVAGALLDTSSRPKPKRRMYKHEIEARDKAIEKRVREKSVADADAHHKSLSKKLGIPLKKIKRGHGSGPLTRNELDRIKAAESGNPIPKSNNSYRAPKTHGRTKEKVAVWAVKKLRNIRKKYENNNDE